MVKRKKSVADKDWEDSHVYSSVTCKLNQLCSDPDLRAEIESSCMIFKQIQSEAWHLANLYVLKCLHRSPPGLPRLNQEFFGWFCEAVRSEGLQVRSTATTDFRKTATRYRNERGLVGGYVPPTRIPYNHNVINWMADQMTVNCKNMIVLNFEKRLSTYVRLVLQDRYEEIAAMSREDRPSAPAQERLLMSIEDRADKRRYPLPPLVPKTEILRLVRACYRSKNGEFTDDEQHFRDWLELQPFENVIEL